MKSFRLLLLFFSFHLLAAAQPDSCSLRITLLTCAPGTELYSIFGHTAIRVQDRSTNADMVFNYGTFEFAPDFYSKFIRGKLRYSLSVEPFQDFLYTYREESRSVVEQEVLISCTQKAALYEALKVNALEENRYYKYDFVYDNCTTRARDIIARHAGAPVQFRNILPPVHPTFRDLIHEYLHRGKQYWSKAGIDLLLGAKLDKRASNLQAMFLPEKLLTGMDTALLQNRRLVAAQQPVMIMPVPPAPNDFFTPAVVFSLVFLAVALLSLSPSVRIQKGMLVFDFLYFLLLGLVGVLLLFMWLGTDHAFCANNFNLLWALPTHLLGAVLVLRRKTRRYFAIIFWVMLAVMISWIFLPQEMNTAFLPLTAIAWVRSWFLSKKSRV